MTTNETELRAGLRAKAEAATPGEWRVAMGGWSAGGTHDGGMIEACRPNGLYRKLEDGTMEPQFDGRQIASFYTSTVPQDEGIANAAYIAAANPSVVIALLDRIEELEGALIYVREHLMFDPESGEAIDILAGPEQIGARIGAALSNKDNPNG